LKKLLGIRGIAAVVGTFMLTLGSGNASAQTVQPAKINYSLSSNASPAYARPLAGSGPVVSAVQRTVTATTDMFSNAVGSVFGTQPNMQSDIHRIAREAAWLRTAGWPLYALVDRFSAGAPLNEEAHCIAVAVYHEARGESLEGQLAVARVIMNRAASGKYPPSWCGTVKQPWQFSFVNPRTGLYPSVNESSAAWSKALGVTRLAIANAYPSLSNDVLWYHADYVAPSWGRRLSRVDKIGAHIFYRA
jgi:N-acetylmuramoyl-L-alanine amidase